MVPAAVVDQNIADLLPHLDAGDILIDGGNSYYVDDIRRAKELAQKKIHYVDVGTSGGVWGLERGVRPRVILGLRKTFFMVILCRRQRFVFEVPFVSPNSSQILGARDVCVLFA